MRSTGDSDSNKAGAGAVSRILSSRRTGTTVIYLAAARAASAINPKLVRPVARPARPPEGRRGRAAPRFLFDLAPDGVCQAVQLAHGPGGLLHRLFTLAPERLAAPPGGFFSVTLSVTPVFPAPSRLLRATGTSCPVESGLSSPPRALRRRRSDRPPLTPTRAPYFQSGEKQAVASRFDRFRGPARRKRLSNVPPSSRPAATGSGAPAATRRARNRAFFSDTRVCLALHSGRIGVPSRPL